MAYLGQPQNNNNMNLQTGINQSISFLTRDGFQEKNNNTLPITNLKTNVSYLLRLATEKSEIDQKFHFYIDASRTVNPQEPFNFFENATFNGQIVTDIYIKTSDAVESTSTVDILFLTEQNGEKQAIAQGTAIASRVEEFVNHLQSKVDLNIEYLNQNQTFEEQYLLPDATRIALPSGEQEQVQNLQIEESINPSLAEEEMENLEEFQQDYKNNPEYQRMFENAMDFEEEPVSKEDYQIERHTYNYVKPKYPHTLDDVAPSETEENYEIEQNTFDYVKHKYPHRLETNSVELDYDLETEKRVYEYLKHKYNAPETNIIPPTPPKKTEDLQLTPDMIRYLKKLMQTVDIEQLENMTKLDIAPKKQKSATQIITPPTRPIPPKPQKREESQYDIVPDEEIFEDEAVNIPPKPPVRPTQTTSNPQPLRPERPYHPEFNASPEISPKSMPKSAAKSVEKAPTQEPTTTKYASDYTQKLNENFAMSIIDNLPDIKKAVGVIASTILAGGVISAGLFLTPAAFAAAPFFVKAAGTALIAGGMGLGALGVVYGDYFEDVYDYRKDFKKKQKKAKISKKLDKLKKREEKFAKKQEKLESKNINLITPNSARYRRSPKAVNANPSVQNNEGKPIYRTNTAAHQFNSGIYVNNQDPEAFEERKQKFENYRRNQAAEAQARGETIDPHREIMPGALYEQLYGTKAEKVQPKTTKAAPAVRDPINQLDNENINADMSQEEILKKLNYTKQNNHYFSELDAITAYSDNKNQIQNHGLEK